MTKAKTPIGFKNLQTLLEIAIITRQKLKLFDLYLALYCPLGVVLIFSETLSIENLRELMNEFVWLFKSQVELISAFPMISFVVVPAGA